MLAATSSIASPTQPPLVTNTGDNGQTIKGIRQCALDKRLYGAGWTGGGDKTHADGDWFTTAEWTRTGNGTLGCPWVGSVSGLTGIMPLNDNANWLGYVPPFSGVTAYQASNLAGIVREVNVIKDGANARFRPVQTIKFVTQSSKPWNYDYDEFKQEIRTKAKDYSVIPEFRMEDHIEDWIVNKSSDFLAQQDSLFRMVGMPSGSNGQDAANSSESQFYTIYGTSDFMKHFDILKNDIDEHYEPSTITLQCNAYLKFNPYDGFYPAHRTLQMAKALSSSYGEHISYTGPAVLSHFPDGADFDQILTLRTTSSATRTIHKASIDADDTQTPKRQYLKTTRWGEVSLATTNLAFRNFITPLYAPGIMFNTIKAGIACDWPVMTHYSKIYKTRAGKSNYWALGFPNPENDDELHSYFKTKYGAAADS